jgi:hypothetical protein
MTLIPPLIFWPIAPPFANKSRRFRVLDEQAVNLFPRSVMTEELHASLRKQPLM